MQTFLPYADFSQSARSLDWQRLGKQRVETFQIMQVLLGYRLITRTVENTGKFEWVYYDLEDNVVTESELEPGVEYHAEHEEVFTIVDLPEVLWHLQALETIGWSRHPAVLMWQGYIPALLSYQRAICAEWVGRGYSDTCLRRCEVLWEKVTGKELPRVAPMPDWMGDLDFHISHRSNLIQKDARHYRPQFRGAPDDLPYLWPISGEN